MADDKRKTLLVDFDGVIHSYESGWQGAAVIADLPIHGAFEWLERASEHFDISIFSARNGQHGGTVAMVMWFMRHGLKDSVLRRLDFPMVKPKAFLTIDDRSIRFEGDWSKIDPSTLLKFKTWQES